MAYGGEDTKRRGDIASLVTRVFEAFGLLNKGSAESPAAPDPSEADKVQPISSNALNVTRVTGVGALIAGAGAAALNVFGVDKAHDRIAIVVAAYAAVGLIVAAALVAVAVIVAADIRARQAIAIATSKAPPPTERFDIKTVDGVTETETEVTFDHVAAGNGGSGGGT